MDWGRGSKTGGRGVWRRERGGGVMLLGGGGGLFGNANCEM